MKDDGKRPTVARVWCPLDYAAAAVTIGGRDRTVKCKDHEHLEPARIQWTLRGVWLVYSCIGS